MLLKRAVFKWGSRPFLLCQNSSSKSGDFGQFYRFFFFSGLKKVVAYKAGSFSGSCCLNNSVLPSGMLISKEKKNTQQLKVSDTVTHKIAYECAISLS